MVFVCLKCGDTTSPDLLEALRALRPGTLVISLQNGVDNAQTLQRLLSNSEDGAPVDRSDGGGTVAGESRSSADNIVVAGMIPYGVNEVGPGHFHRGTAGALAFAMGRERSWLIRISFQSVSSDQFRTGCCAVHVIV